ncbi:Uncharacterised protein [Vibrio cholerae]|nr:Uncharacterised protein [Vibrio cholerae]
MFTCAMMRQAISGLSLGNPLRKALNKRNTKFATACPTQNSSVNTTAFTPPKLCLFLKAKMPKFGM